jgi:hypothetical protein
MAAHSASASAQPGWWDDAYQFRRTVTVVNEGSSPVFNRTAIAHVNFNGTFTQDALASVRLVDSSGNEVPSVVVGPQYSGVFLMSAYLVFSADVPAGSSSAYYLYYGGSSQPVPSYRQAQPAGSLGAGFTTASERSLSVDSTQIQLGLGSVDTETTMSKVTYALGGHSDYGPAEIALLPFYRDTGLVSSGDIGGASRVAFDAMQAGAVRLTRIVILSAQGAVVIDAIASDSSSTVPGLRLTTLVGLGGLSSLGTTKSNYDAGPALLSTQNSDGKFVVSLSPRPASYALGTTAAVSSEALSGTFNGVSSYVSASAAGFSWTLGDLEPQAAVWTSSSCGVSSAGSAASPSPPLAADLGNAEVRGIATPIASSIWSATATITDVSVPAGGVTIPFGIGSRDLKPGASSVTGTYAYTFPLPPQDAPRSWVPYSLTGGNATAQASQQYYDFATGQTVSRLLADVPDKTSTSAASLGSVGGFTFGGTNDSLQVRYRASYSVLSGNFSSQSFFAAADFDPTLTGNYSQTIFLPVSGSSTVLTAECPTPGSNTRVITSAAPSEFLVGDGTWRTLSVGLPPSLPTSGFNVRVRLCVLSSSGFVGTMSLEVTAAGVVHRGSISRILQTTFSHTAPEVFLGYLPQAQPISGAGVKANLTISLVFQTKAPIGWVDGSTFGGLVSSPRAFTLNDSSLRRTATLSPPALVGILVNSGVSQLAQSGRINGAAVPASPDPGAVFLDGGGSFGPFSASPFEVALQGETMQVQVLDQDRSGVQGAVVVPSADGVNIPVTLVTDSSGGAKVQLVPWTYHFNATYQGAFVGTAGAQVGAVSSVSIPANIYQLTLVVKDNRGGIMPGAQVTLTIGNLTFTGTTNNQGRYPFEAVANAIYGLTVGIGSETYFSGQIGATANNAVVQVTTSYLPSSIQLAIAVLLAIIPVALIVAYFASRRLKRTR